jgi:hypothetical protein
MEDVGIFDGHLVYIHILRPIGIFMDIWSILCYGHLVYFVVVCCIFPHFGLLHQEKSGNPVPD